MIKMKKRLFIIHGYDASPQKHWFPWLKKTMEKEGYEVNIPKMPMPTEPELHKWIEELTKTVNKIDENTYFVAHSLGTITLLQYLSEYKELPNFKGFIMVSGFDEKIPNFEILEHFTKKKVNYDKIKSKAKTIFVIASENDTIVPIDFSKKLSKKLDSEMYILKSSGHFLDRDGILEIPLIEELLKKM